MRKIETKIYPFAELSESAKQSAIQGLWDINMDYDWWDYSFDYFKELAEVIGINIENIYFSGFSSQGDGAQFTGTYSYNKNWKKKLKGITENAEILDIAERLYLVQKVHFYQLSATVISAGRYSHSLASEITVYKDNEYSDYLNEDTEEDIKTALRDFMDWIYNQLENNYEYLTSEKSIIETIESNGCEFTENGEMI